ncbi:hypothetical protein GCM10010317_012890 [Streptomyces mirabilis]|nr:hypothetical protein GCM10010317_012890 [Streptomyces mirabilis]
MAVGRVRFLTERHKCGERVPDGGDRGAGTMAFQQVTGVRLVCHGKEPEERREGVRTGDGGGWEAP